MASSLRRRIGGFAVTIILICFRTTAAAQAAPPSASPPHRVADILKFLGGAGVGLGLHEGSHLLADALFGADPGTKVVYFGPIPFFAITHRPLPPRQEFVVASAGFWSQYATSEWILTRRPGIRHESAPFAKGVLAFDVLASVAYAGAALAQAGPLERDTLAMATATGIDEPWIGVMVLAPAALDAVRYIDPEARWAKWSSRAAKIAVVLLIVKASGDP